MSICKLKFTQRVYAYTPQGDAMSEAKRLIPRGERYAFCRTCKRVTRQTKGYFTVDGDFYNGSICQACDCPSQEPVRAKAN